MNEQQPKFLLTALPTFDNVIWMAAFFGVFLGGRRMINADGDLALHLNLGKYILDTGKIPLQDVFSHTLPGQSVTQHEWLSTLILESIKQIFGLEGVIFLCALVISGTIYLLFKHIQSKTQTLLPVLLVVALALINSIVHWLARPHIFTFLLLTLWLITLDHMRSGRPKHWLFLPCLMVFWVNLHGGFIIGFITWFIFGFGIWWDKRFKRLGDNDKLPHQFWRAYLLGGVASLFVSLINPSGVSLWVKVVSHMGNRYLADITNEFQSPNFHTAIFWPFLIYIGLLVVVLGLSKKRSKSELLFNGVVWLILGLYSARHIPLFGIAAAPLLANALEDLLLNANPDVKFSAWIKGLDRRLQVLDGQLKGVFWPILSILIAILGLSLGLHFDIDGEGYAFDPEVFPIEAVDWLEANPQEGEMLNYFTWGGYLQYRLLPEKRVFIDSKSDFYGENFVRQYAQVIAQQDGWEDVLDQYNVEWAILPIDEPVVDAIQRDLGWEVIYEDETAVVLIRQ